MIKIDFFGEESVGIRVSDFTLEIKDKHFFFWEVLVDDFLGELFLEVHVLLFELVLGRFNIYLFLVFLTDIGLREFLFFLVDVEGDSTLCASEKVTEVIGGLAVLAFKIGALWSFWELIFFVILALLLFGSG